MLKYTEFQRVQRHQEESAVLRAYISEWKKFLILIEYLPKPFSFIYEGQSNHSSISKANKTKKISPAVTTVSSSISFYI